MPESAIDTTNYSLVSVSGQGHILFIRPLPQGMDKARALNLAAWLVALADDNDEFPALLEAVKTT